MRPAALLTLAACAFEPADPVALVEACPWTTSTGRHSCGAQPPRETLPEQAVTWLPGVSLHVASDGAGGAVTASHAMPAIDFTGQMPKLSVAVSGAAHADRLELGLGDAGLQNAFWFRFDSTQAQQWVSDGDPGAFTIPWSEARLVGNPDRAAITEVQLAVTDTANRRRVRVTIDGLGLVPEPPGGLVSFTFDDNHHSSLLAAPILAAAGLTATAYVIVETVGKPGSLTLADLQALHEQGWEIAAHAYSGQHHAATFPNLDAVTLEDDLVSSRAWLIRNGFTGQDHCAYPHGMFTGGRLGTDVLGVVRRYFTTCRTIFQAEREAWPPSDPHKLRVLHVTAGTTLEEAWVAVDRAASSRDWLILVFHRLTPGTPRLDTEWNVDDFAALVGHAAGAGLALKTIGR
jgi:peptidoglycan/xylan/chitin deacetylase (PgdA/CDA1 family)